MSAFELNTFLFSNDSDRVIISTTISNSGTTNSLAGNDNIKTDGGEEIIPLGTLNFLVAFSNIGTLLTYDGNDKISATVTSTENNALGFFNNLGIVDTGTGNDSITGNAEVSSSLALRVSGINNSSGLIETGEGNDQIIGNAKTNSNLESRGIFNFGNIKTGTGNDLIVGNIEAIVLQTSPRAEGIVHIGSSSQKKLIETESGNDQIIGTAEATGSAIDRTVSFNTSSGMTLTRAEIHTGCGNDLVSGDSIARGLNNLATTARGINLSFDNSLNPSIITGEGNDQIRGNAQATTEINGLFTTTAIGIDKSVGAIFNTGLGNDEIIGQAKAETTNFGSVKTIGIFDFGLTETGHGNDTINGIAESITSGTESESIGINTGVGTITTGLGNDRLSGVGKAIATSEIPIARGISHFGTIDVGDGNDEITGLGEVSGGSKVYGIFGNSNSKIQTGAGNDELIARAFSNGSQIFSQGFGGGVQVEMGDGNDSVLGFGEAIIKGGLGFDEIILEGFNFHDFTTGGGNITVVSESNAVKLTIDNVTMIMSEFELFQFNDTSLSFLELTSF